MFARATAPSAFDGRGALLVRLRSAGGRDASLAMVLAAVVLVVAFSGDLIRYTVGWTGYGITVVALTALSVVLIVRRRPSLRLRHFPHMLLLFVAWSGLSLLWSEYRLETLVAWLAQLCAAVIALAMAVSLTRMQFLRTLGAAMRTLVFGSLAFELGAALFAPYGVLPPLYLRPGVLQQLLGEPAPHPIPGGFYWTHSELFHGGPLQGLMGNRNLLAMVALIALVVTAIEVFDQMLPRWYGALASGAAILTIVLTDSATVYVAAAFVLLGATLVLIGRRLHRRLRWLLYLVVGAALVTGGTLVVLFNNEVFAAMNRSSDMSGRGVIWRAVLAFGAESPVVGHGWIGYWAPWLPQFHNLAVIDGMAYHQAHNAFIDAWMQLGAVGVLLLVGLVLSTLIRTWWVAIDVAATPRVPWFWNSSGRHLAVATATPFLLMVALVVQAMTESRLLIEGDWLLLAYFSIYARLRIQNSALLPRRFGAPGTGPVPVVLDTRP